MKIENILLCVPRAVIFGVISKIPRFELSQKAMDMVIQNGMYHFVYNEDTADKIIGSEHLRPSNNFISYGRKCAFMFCGGPSIDNYAKNLCDFVKDVNPYTNPTKVQTAIKFTPQRKDLVNYRFRGLTDNVFTYEGTCILPHQQVKKVKMVPDLIRDKEGKPIKDKKGEFQAAFREATQSEIMPDGKNYRAKDDYLQYMKEKAIEYGYYNKNGNKTFLPLRPLNFVMDLIRMESDEAKRTFGENANDILNNFLGKIKNILNQKAIQKSAEDLLEDFSFKRKNPFRDPKFSQKIAKLQTNKGIIQSDLRDMLEEFNNSQDGEFYSNKYNLINGKITKNGIHGKKHADRVSLSAMMIAHNEGIFDKDKDNRIKDILATASMYHDIGRITNHGPHARRGARKIKKMDLHFANGKSYSEEDKALVMALIDAHEGKPDKINKSLKKYRVSQDDIEIGKKLSSIVRDADALDRVRIDNNLLTYKVNLNPDFLVNNTAKGMILQAYQLEYMTKKVPNFNNILKFKTDNSLNTRKNNFKDIIKEVVKGPIIIKSQVILNPQKSTDHGQDNDLTQ